ncbi:ATP-grasp domain-containing protein [Micromonospora sp. NBC_01796]|uniref:ATP-grasp domain-containing protein n=1 Tax=Micromonospora sp. NBC_01796 TaxID=2975987 RepID=UPI002DD8BB15|nr:ATP-grasp domain-containing protein [Micromonospora sp. NBC_01796]WSA88169.1 ATP-grasp domain-containing protein [Micromonospora sp. NBC_01796]
MPRLLVTGAAGPAGRALLHALAMRAVPAIGVDMAPADGRAPGGPGPDGIERVPAATDGSFLPELLTVAHHHGVDLIVPTVTEELPVLAPLAARSTRPAVLLSPPSAVAIADDKWRTVQVLAAAGVAVPRSVLPGVLSPQALRGYLGWPYLSKPRRGRGGRGVRVHDRTGTPPPDPGDLLQEFIPGTEYAVDVFADRLGRVEAIVVLRKTTLAQGRVGNAVRVVRDNPSDVADLARAAVRAIGVTGPADLDIRRRRDGTPVVLEVNARFGAHSGQAPELLDALLAGYGVGFRAGATT